MPRKANILVVDDKPANLLAMEAVLGSEHNLVLAGSGEEALALLRARRDIDLILLDVQMPGLDGFETALQVRAVEHCREVPIIFVTAVYTEDPFIRRGYEVGGIDYFSKPFDPEVLRWWEREGQALRAPGGALARALAAAEASYRGRLDIRCLDGVMKTIAVSAFPLHGLDARVVGAVVLVQDVTEPRRIERDLEERVARLVSLGVELEESASR